MKKGEKMSQELKDKLSLAHKGKVFSDEHKKNLSLAHKGKMPSNLEQLRAYRKGRPLTEEHKQKIGQAQIGKFVSEETRKKMSKAGKGRVAYNKGKGDIEKKCIQCGNNFISKKYAKRKFCSQDCCKKSNTRESHYRWKHDRTELVGRHNRSKHDPEVKQWRKTIFKRDNFTCKLKSQDCEGKIEAHHIYRWIDYPELRYEVSNGITLCHKHHPRARKKEDEMIKQFQSLIS